MSSSSRVVCVSTCSRPTGCGGRARQRHVDCVLAQPCSQLGAAQLARARGDQRLQRLARLVGGPADRRPLLGGVESATPRSSCGSSALRPR